MSVRLPLPWSLDPSSESSEEPEGPPSVREQTAVVRTLAHALEQLPSQSDAAEALRLQLAEELTRLGYRIQEAAASRQTSK